MSYWSEVVGQAADQEAEAQHRPLQTHRGGKQQTCRAGWRGLGAVIKMQNCLTFLCLAQSQR